MSHFFIFKIQLQLQSDKCRINNCKAVFMALQVWGCFSAPSHDLLQCQLQKSGNVHVVLIRTGRSRLLELMLLLLKVYHQQKKKLFDFSLHEQPPLASKQDNLHCICFGGLMLIKLKPKLNFKRNFYEQNVLNLCTSKRKRRASRKPSENEKKYQKSSLMMLNVHQLLNSIIIIKSSCKR